MKLTKNNNMLKSHLHSNNTKFFFNKNIIENNILDERVYSHYRVIHNNGSVTSFKPNKISTTIEKAYCNSKCTNTKSSYVNDTFIKTLTSNIVKSLIYNCSKTTTFHVKDILYKIEQELVNIGEHKIVHEYISSKKTYIHAHVTNNDIYQYFLLEKQPLINVIKKNGSKNPLDLFALLRIIESACLDLGTSVSVKPIIQETVKNLYNDMPIEQVYESIILASRTCIEREPAYSKATARLLLHKIRHEVFGEEVEQEDMCTRYINYFPEFIKRGIEAKLLDTRLSEFNLQLLVNVIDADRDLKFRYLGLQTLYDRYFLHINQVRIELPQIFFMRVAMGLAVNEVEREKFAMKFYDILSNFNFMMSTPTLFNSGTRLPQLSSCYLTTIPDELSGIYESLKDNALLSKFAGGIGNDWTQVRALGSHIKSTNGKSQGVVPFLKVFNDTAIAVNQGGKRKGAICAYLEIWHLDIEEFLELRKNTGDDRRRTQDMNTAIWVPDLFMKRVIEAGEWILFSPSTCPDLHNKFGVEFELAYLEYTKRVINGEIKLFRKVSALQLWRKMLSMLFETGHPWITFKDPCNIRSPQQHIGVIHSSNLCTEITLNTSDEEIAVCNLGSINLVEHLKIDNKNYKLNHKKLLNTINIAMRMLDNVIDINYYAVKKAYQSNLKHRPVGLGIMGFQDCLHMMRISYASEEAITFADQSMEAVCYYAYYISTKLAKERGCYSTYYGSLWQKGILPQDSIQLLAKVRDKYLDIDCSSRMNWIALRKRIKKYGMRNSNCVAIAPTATISNIIGVSASIEPTFQNIFVKSNLSGEFTIINELLVKDLKAHKIWDEIMISDLKYFDGNLAKIKRIPHNLRILYATAFEIDAKWLVEAASRRQKWIDQSQSLNIYMAGASGKKLDQIYKLAWVRGLKTTYYLRTMALSHVEKSTSAHGILNAVSINQKTQYLSTEPISSSSVKKDNTCVSIKKCIINSDDRSIDICEVCQ